MKVYFKKYDDTTWIISGVSKGTRWAPGDSMISPNDMKVAIKKIVEKFPETYWKIASSNNIALLEFHFDKLEDDAFFTLWVSNGIEL